MRTADIRRDTRETRIQLSLNLDGTGKADIATGVGFLDHMLELFARHGDFDLTIRCQGDTQVDGHHSVEDIGICLGRAFAEALGDKRGITRYGQFLLPMDETLVLAAVDISGRGQLHWDVDVPLCLLGSFDTSLAKEFFIAFATNAQVTLHVRMITGENAHHIVEACFKAVGRALCQALEINPRIAGELPSTKGAL